MSPRVFYNIRECTKERKGTFHLWSNGNPYPKRWTSAYHFHAMWSHSFLCRCKSQITKQSFERYLIPRFTSYRSITDDKQSITTLYQLLSEDEIRNTLIVEDVFKAVEAGRTPIILTNRTAHVTMLAEKLRDKVKNVVTLTGTGNAKEKLETLQHLYEISRENLWR